MRLHIRVRERYYYDIGLRKGSTLSKTSWQFGEQIPRYLEDFIEKYGESCITILDYGSLWEEKEYINDLLK